MHNNIKDKNKSIRLELLLSGKKPIALFYDLLPTEFVKHLEQGTLTMLSKDIETSLPVPFSIMLIYKDASLEDLNELVLCIEKSLKETQLEDRLALDRKIGQLLGYSAQDIEFYIQHVSNRHFKRTL